MPFIVKVQEVRPVDPGAAGYTREESQDIYEQRFSGLNLGAIIQAANGFEISVPAEPAGIEKAASLVNHGMSNVGDLMTIIRHVEGFVTTLPPCDQKKDALHHLEQAFFALNAYRETQGPGTTAV